MGLKIIKFDKKNMESPVRIAKLKDSEQLTMTVKMVVNEAQALALQAMFEYWRYCGGIGSSRDVAFFVDGDGNFQPKCEVSFDKEILPLNDEIRKLAVRSDKDGERVYDFDNIGWAIHYGKNMYTGKEIPASTDAQQNKGKKQ